MRLSVSLTCSCLAFVCLLFAAATTRAGDDWKPVNPAELAMKTPVVDKDADAEVLFWEVRLDDSSDDVVLNHYIRVKIFTDRGRENNSKVELSFGKLFGRERKVKDIAARTIKADGTILELKKEDILESVKVKADGVKLKVKAFSLPGVEPGAIIEYRWKEVRENSSANYIRFDLQREIPVQRVTYYLKPSGRVSGNMTARPFNCKFPGFKDEPNNFSSFTYTNLPAFQEEPQMPPENQVKKWILVYYQDILSNLVPSLFWRRFATMVYEANKDEMKLNDDVRRATAEAIGNATAPEDKLHRLFDYCRAKIKNLSFEGSGLTAEVRDKAKENKSPGDTLKRGMGTRGDIDHLFAAMATAAGFTVKWAQVPERNEIFFDADFASPYFILDNHVVAVQVGTDWRFFVPGNMYVPYGMLHWEHEAQSALLGDEKELVWLETPLTPPEKSQAKRKGTLTLSEDGTLEGDVALEYTGHRAIEFKEQYEGNSESEREKDWVDDLKQRMPAVEVTKFRMENVTDPDKPLAVSYHIRVPEYAQRTGKRFFVQPAFFQYGRKPIFPANDRKQMIYFDYPWSENDETLINLPAGYALDNADAPAPFGAGPLSQYQVTLSLATDNKTKAQALIYKRSFFFGGGGNDMSRLLYPVSTYPQLKKYFDMVSEQDSHTIALKHNAEAGKTN